ncbi:MAG: NAD(P)/FAD-dependent oxidoreductase [Candidatus Puniceispirillales bacterium]|jgi:predicted Rossmann fold flavoprotein|tara:strand:- start:1190 stop:2371 length:1182 start_codon:yes stop_codon:yes gene_type:complete
MNKKYDVIIIGAGAAGLMSAIEAGKRGKIVFLIDHSTKIAEKIRISGGGRCNFTNLYSNPSNFLSNNKHFCKSAFAKYTQNDFIDLIEKHNIEFFEKKLGQLFCNTSAKEIIDMLVKECIEYNVNIDLETKVTSLSKSENEYIIKTNKGTYTSKSMVIATGGLSIPKIGASDFGYRIAKQFDLKVTDLFPALVPLTFEEKELEFCKSLAGVSLNASVKVDKTIFNEGLIFTHRGISGPSILQISSYWKSGQPISINLLPGHNMDIILKQRRNETPKQTLSNVLADYLPNKLALAICNKFLINQKIADASNEILKKLSDFVNNWIVYPKGTEGYKTAEVTLGGIDTKEISSSTMECIKHPGLFFIGEVLDVTGHLGGHNFQWAWSSGFVAGQNV